MLRAMQSQARKLKYHVAMTLDGFIAREDDTIDFFPHISPPEYMLDYLDDLGSAYDTVVMGRSTYQVALRMGVTDPYPSMETHVCSRSMQEIADPRVHLVREDAVGFVSELKSRPGKQKDMSRVVRSAGMSIGKNIYLCGGGLLATSLFDAGLIDEVLIKLNPVMLGAGKALAPRLTRLVGLELLSTKAYSSGVVLLHYTVKR